MWAFGHAHATACPCCSAAFRFRGQFVKVLKCMYEEFLPELGRSKEEDIQAVHTLLEHYLTHGQYNVEPEGRSMPKVDMSQYQRA